MSRKIINITSPLPNISTLAILISPENPPKSPKWGPQNEFPGVTQTKGFCGNSTATWISWNFSARPDFGFWDPHFQRFGDKWSWYVGQRWPSLVSAVAAPRRVSTTVVVKNLVCQEKLRKPGPGEGQHQETQGLGALNVGNSLYPFHTGDVHKHSST